MSNTVIKATSLRESMLGSASFKKRRRRRCKDKNFSLKKKKLKKINSSKALGNIEFKSTSGKIMSDWYWSNYRKAIQWQHRHKVAHWKSFALALLEENRCLLQMINSMHPGMLPVESGDKNLAKGMNYGGLQKILRPSKYCGFSHSYMAGATEEDDNVNDDDASEEENEEEGGDFEFEMSEEMIQFFEQSYKHKMDLKKLKEKEMLNNMEQEIKKIQSNKLKRSTEMNLLYGDGASMIIGMETAVQLSFDKYCDTKSPKYWPNIPFRL